MPGEHACCAASSFNHVLQDQAQVVAGSLCKGSMLCQGSMPALRHDVRTVRFASVTMTSGLCLELGMTQQGNNLCSVVQEALLFVKGTTGTTVQSGCFRQKSDVWHTCHLGRMLHQSAHALWHPSLKTWGLVLTHGKRHMAQSNSYGIFTMYTG